MTETVAPEKALVPGLAPETALAARLMVEVARETRRRRAAGEVSEAAEREVDAAFERFAPKSTAGSCPDDLLAAVERASVIDAAVPLAGRHLGEAASPDLLGQADAAARRLVRKSMAWYVNHVTQQSNRFSSAEVGLLGMLDQRIAALETRSGPDLQPAHPARLARWTPLVLELLDCVKGRVLHAECGDGWLVYALVARGLDAYGVDPGGRVPDASGPDASGPDASGPDASGLDVWSDDVATHLGAVGDGGLAGLVLSGCVECVAPVVASRLATLARAKLVPGGRLVLLASKDQPVPTPLADLTGARSMDPGTWRHLLALAGFQSPTAQLAEDSFAITGQA